MFSLTTSIITVLDVTKPVIKNCPAKPYYVLKYGTVTIDPPLNFTDNSGAVASVEWSFDLREPIINDMTVTVSATDHFGNVGICTVEIKVRGGCEDELLITNQYGWKIVVFLAF